MNVSWGVAFLMVVFCSATLFFTLYAWWARDRPEYSDALSYAILFWFAWLLVVLVWRVTFH
jgi:hypothetical protein